MDVGIAAPLMQLAQDLIALFRLHFSQQLRDLADVRHRNCLVDRGVVGRGPRRRLLFPLRRRVFAHHAHMLTQVELRDQRFPPRQTVAQGPRDAALRSKA